MMLIEETTLDQLAMPVPAFKDHLRLGTGFTGTTLQDPVLEGFLSAAIAAIEGRTSKVLLQRDFRWTLSNWRDDHAQALPVAPVHELLSFELVDAAGTRRVVDPSLYRLQEDSSRPLIVGAARCLPMIPTQGSAVIRIRAGLATSFEALPKDLAQAVMLLAAHYYEYRSATELSAGCMPFGVSSLIERYKTVRLFAGRAS